MTYYKVHLPNENPYLPVERIDNDKPINPIRIVIDVVTVLFGIFLGTLLKLIASSEKKDILNRWLRDKKSR